MISYDLRPKARLNLNFKLITKSFIVITSIIITFTVIITLIVLINIHNLPIQRLTNKFHALLVWIKYIV